MLLLLNLGVLGILPVVLGQDSGTETVEPKTWGLVLCPAGLRGESADVLCRIQCEADFGKDKVEGGTCEPFDYDYDYKESGADQRRRDRRRDKRQAEGDGEEEEEQPEEEKEVGQCMCQVKREKPGESSEEVTDGRNRGRGQRRGRGRPNQRGGGDSEEEEDSDEDGNGGRRGRGRGRGGGRRRRPNRGGGDSEEEEEEEEEEDYSSEEEEPTTTTRAPRGRGRRGRRSRDCQVSDWEPVGDCSEPCGEGEQLWRRRVLRQQRRGGRRCPRLLEQQRSCFVKECEYSGEEGGGGTQEQVIGISATGSANVSAAQKQTLGKGGGDQSQVVNVAVTGGDGGSDSEEEEADVDCLSGDWTPWNACSRSCGGGTRFRTRAVLRQQAGRGEPCGRTVRTKTCNRQACDGSGTGGGDSEEEKEPVDCRVSEWMEEGGCSASCGGGRQRWERDVLREAANGGLRCPRLRRSSACNDFPCPGSRGGGRRPPRRRPSCDSEWSEWGVCDVDCGRGRQTRRRFLKLWRSGCKKEVNRRDCYAGDCDYGPGGGEVDEVEVVDEIGDCDDWESDSHSRSKSKSKYKSKSKRKSKSKYRRSRRRKCRRTRTRTRTSSRTRTVRRRGRTSILSRLAAKIRGIID